MGHLTSDLRRTIRSLARSPAFTSIAVGTMAVLICGVTLIVSLVEGALLNPGPYRDADRLVVVRVEGPGGAPGSRVFPYDDYVRLRESIGSRDEVIEDLVAVASRSLFNFLVTGNDEPLWLRGAQVTGRAFPMLGVPPLLGRGLMAEDERPRAEPVIVLHEDVWRVHFGADPAAVGRAITVNDQAHVIVGVMPRAFRWGALDAWTPLRPDLYVVGSEPPHVRMWARLRAGVSEEQARARMTSLFAGLAVQRPDRYPPNQTVALEYQHSLEVRGGRVDLASTFLTLLGTVAILVVAGCINITALLLARATTRANDLAVRLSLGASRGAVLRGQLVDVAVMTTAATALGVWLAWTLLPGVIRAIPEGALPNDADVAVNWRVLGMMAGVTTALTLVCALLPAWLVTRMDVEALLRGGAKGSAGTGGGNRIWQVLVVGEVAVAMVLLVLTAMVGERLLALGAVPLGWEPDRVLSLGVSLSPTRYPSKEPARQVQFMRQVLDRYRDVRGVEAASLGGPPAGGVGQQAFVLAGRVARETDRAAVRPVGGDYLRTYGIPVRQGREIARSDEAATRPVAVVNEAFVHTFLDGGSPLGRTIQMIGGLEAYAPVYEIVGVAGNTTRPGGSVSPEIYVPFTVSPMSSRGSFLLDVRTTSSDPRQMLGPLQRELWAVDPNQPFGYIRTAREWLLGGNVMWSRFQALMFGAFGTIALLLAAGGVYGVLSFRMSREARYLGVRVALGATPREIVRHAFARGVQPAVLGTILGGLLALAMDRVASTFLAGTLPASVPSLLPGIIAPGVVSYALASGLLLAVSVVACYLPARRAASVNPIVVLRPE